MNAVTINAVPIEQADDYWGLCPTCHKTDGFANHGRDHYFLCEEHKVMWCVGSNLFSSWRDDPAADTFCANYGHYEIVKPFYHEVKIPRATRAITKGELLENYARHNPIYFLEFDGDASGHPLNPDADKDGHLLESRIVAELFPNCPLAVRLQIQQGSDKATVLKRIDKIRDYVEQTHADDFNFQVRTEKPESALD